MDKFEGYEDGFDYVADKVCSSREGEIATKEAARFSLLLEAGIPLDLLGKRIVIYEIWDGDFETFVVDEIIETRVETVHFDGRHITLIVPPGLRFYALKRDLVEEDAPWLAMEKRRYVCKNNRMPLSLACELFELIQVIGRKDRSGFEGCLEAIGTRLKAIYELREMEIKGTDEDYMENLLASQGSWFIEEVSSHVEDELHEESVGYPTHVYFPD